MQGQGHHHPVAPPPTTGLLVFLRILFVTIALGSIGFLMWVPLLRLAIVTRKTVDWVLCGLSFVLLVVSVALLLSEPDDEVDTPAETVGVLLLLLTMLAVVSYYLAADIRHFDERRRQADAALAGHGHGHGHARAYGYPQNTGPYGYPVLPQQQPGTWSGGGHTPAPHHTPTPSHTPAAAHTPPPPTTPAPGGRIDQVRAELDELSELLRKQDGGPEDVR
ncbi:hypothetical protein [Streptomyces fragilis]|uniref:Integral membrane protein n=1 Tax=Streptomyces fragilis TaxID=67301 RepID=A0ABV2YGE2_9ACTN|nr:hypothetical protein [Streptomyces fragilis]